MISNFLHAQSIKNPTQYFVLSFENVQTGKTMNIAAALSFKFRIARGQYSLLILRGRQYNILNIKEKITRTQKI